MTIKERVLKTVETVIDSQNKKGLKKYGETLDDCDPNSYDWQQMIIEELIDALQYQQKELKKQAERVRELEEELLYYKMATESYVDMEQQNKRYREALEFYADRDNYKLEHFDPNLDDYMSTVDYDEGQKARRTIGSEKIND